MSDLFGVAFWSSAEVAEVFGVSPQRLGVLCKTGVLPLPTNGLHEPKAVVTAYVRHLKQRDESRSNAGEAVRKIQLENEIRTIKLQRLAGALVEVNQVQADWFEATRQVRDGLLNLPSRLSGVFAAESNQEKIFEAFTKEIHAVLTDLARERAWQPTGQMDVGLSLDSNPVDKSEMAGGLDLPDRTPDTDDEPIVPIEGSPHAADEPEGTSKANDVSDGRSQAERFTTGD